MQILFFYKAINQEKNLFAAYVIVRHCWLPAQDYQNIIFIEWPVFDYHTQL